MAVEYPDSLPNPLYNGYQENPYQGYFVTEMDYESKRRPKYSGIFKINVNFKFTGQQFNNFNAWYYGDKDTELLRGVRTFNAKWEVLGVSTNYEFAFSKDGQPRSRPTSPNAYEVKAVVELKTDVFEIIALNSLDGFCPELIDCQRDLLIWAITA